MGKQSYIEKLTGTASGGIVPLSRATLLTPASNVGRMYSPIAGILTGLDIFFPNGAIPGDWTFNFFINGVAKFSGGTRLTLNAASRHATKTGLAFVVAKDDLLTFDLQVAGSGPINGPVQFTIIIDDQTAITITAGDGISIDDSDPANPVISNTGILGLTAGTGIGLSGTMANVTITNNGVRSVSAGTNISVDNTDPKNPIIANNGVRSVSAGTNIAVDNTDPKNPVIANNGVRSLAAGTGCTIDNTDPKNPIVNVTGGTGGVGTSNSWDVTLIKPTTESRNTNTTLTDDTDLKFTVLAGQIYAFEATIFLTCSASGVAAKFRYHLSQTCQQLRVMSEFINAFASAGGGGSPNGSIYDTNQTDGTTNVVGATGGNFSRVDLKGYVKGHATLNSVFSFQWAQNASSGTNLNVEFGSVLSYKKV